MTRKIMAGAALCALSTIGLGATAFAGERNGQGEPVPAVDHAHSACAYSGLEDFNFEADVQPGTVQNYGHVEDDPVFEIVDAPKGASEMTVILHFPEGDVGPIVIGCNPHAGGEVD